MNIKPYYDCDGITIYHGDCREILPHLPKVDLVLTDPPYGIGADSNQYRRADKQYGHSAAPSTNYGYTDWDKPLSMTDFNMMMGKAPQYIIWGGNYYKLPPSRCWLIWDKENGKNDYADAEMAWTNLDKPVRLKRHMWHGMLRKGQEQRLHPTQKPLEVMEWAILQTENAQTILDPFMGSGTTLVAAKQLHRKAIGIEIEEKYCAIAVKRLGQGVLPL